MITKSKSRILALSLLLISPVANAGLLDLFSPEDPSARISITSSGPVGKRSGDKAVVTGTIELVDSKNRGESCTSFLKRKGLKVRAFFPDATTEVTSRVTLTPSGSKISLRYETPALAPSDTNTLTIVVSKEGGYVLQAILAKIEWSIRELIVNIVGGSKTPSWSLLPPFKVSFRQGRPLDSTSSSRMLDSPPL